MELQAQRIRYEPGYRMGPHSDGCRRLSILVGGELAESDRERTLSVRIGAVGLKAPDFVHHNCFGDQGTSIVSVILPDAVVVRLGSEAHTLDAWRWHQDPASSILALRLAAALRSERGEVAATCLQGLLPGFRQQAPPEPPAPRARMDRIAGILRRSDGPEPVAALAAEERLHPVTLGRQFREYHGCSMTEFRQRARVLGVARVLLTRETPLTAVACDHGFSDLSHMTRIFRRNFGVPPGLFRRLLQDRPDSDGSLAEEWRLTA